MEAFKNLLKEDGHFLAQHCDIEKLRRSLSIYGEIERLWTEFYAGNHSVLSELEKKYKESTNRTEYYAFQELYEIYEKVISEKSIE